MRILTTLLFISSFIAINASATIPLEQIASCPQSEHSITIDDITAAQKAWGDGIVNIGKSANRKEAATALINELYGYNLGLVLFKPTKAAQNEFRSTKIEALSYFISGIEPEDKGFALEPFTKVRFENYGLIISCDSALAMGNYYFTNNKGKEFKVDYSFSYILDKDKKLKINLHHSSLPYKPE